MDLVDLLKNTKWHEWHIRERSPLFIFFIFHAAAHNTHPLFPYAVKTGGIVLNHVLSSLPELEDYRQKMWRFHQDNPKGILQIMQDMYEKNAQDKIFWVQYKDKDWNKSTNEELLEIYKKFIVTEVDYGPSVFLPLAIEKLLTDTAVEILQKEFGVDWKQYENTVMTPIKESHSILARRSLLSINSENTWQKHLENFSFLKNKGFFLEFYSKAEYQAELQKISNPESELAILEMEKAEREKTWQEMLEKINNQKAWLVLQTTNEAIFFRTWRTEAIIQLSWYVQDLFAEIARRLNIRETETVYLLPNEIESGLKEKIDYQNIIKERHRAWAIIISDKVHLMEGKEVEKLIPYLPKIEAWDGVLRGVPAFQGKVTGKVLVVKDRADFSKIINAEILVTHCTFPEMVPYLAKVKAIVTEEGGILSHAALISREFKIPSVIGTKIATQILQSGDLVEVDAENGIIRKI